MAHDINGLGGVAASDAGRRVQEFARIARAEMGPEENPGVRAQHRRPMREAVWPRAAVPRAAVARDA